MLTRPGGKGQHFSMNVFSVWHCFLGVTVTHRILFAVSLLVLMADPLVLAGEQGWKKPFFHIHIPVLCHWDQSTKESA